MHKALGRGLDALLPPTNAAAAREGVAMIAADKIRPNRSQPRVHFNEESLKELADSIRSHGLAQPLLVSPLSAPGEYELVAGERRLRAAKLAGLAQVPCMVRTVTDRERHEISLIENIQREDLNPMEEAESLRRLMDEFSVTQEEAARALGKSRSAVANKVRLLELPEDVRAALRDGRLSEGHARALLGLEGAVRQSELGRRVLEEKLTVRDVEKIVSDWAQAARDGRLKKPARKNPDVRHIEEELQRSLGRRVLIDAKAKSKGWVRLEFYSIDDLHVLTTHLKKKK